MTQALWSPGNRRTQEANISRFMRLIRRERDPGVVDYESLYRFSIDSPKAFWRAIWEFAGVIGSAGPRTVENFDRMPGASWFPDASLNFAENLLRYRDDREALIFKSETGAKSTLTYRQLYRQVAGVASALRELGVEPGDRVAAYMPNLPETIIAMLATTSIGAIWSSCSPDFGISGVVDRLGQIEPKVLFCAAAYTYNGKQHDCLSKVSEIQKQIDSIQKVIVIPYVDPAPDLSGLENAELLASFSHKDADEVEFTRLPFNHPVYILYSSGTTGVPKCIAHGAGGTLLQHLKELMLHTDLKRSDRFFYFTTCGWMMWNWMVSGLATGATLVLYEGSPFYPGPLPCLTWSMNSKSPFLVPVPRPYPPGRKPVSNPVKPTPWPHLKRYYPPVHHCHPRALITFTVISNGLVPILHRRRHRHRVLLRPGCPVFRSIEVKYSAWDLAWR